MKWESRQCSRWLLWALFFSVLLASADISWGDETDWPKAPLSSQSSGNDSDRSPSSSSKVAWQPTALPESIVELWSQFRAEYPSFRLNLESFLDQVEAFGISLEDLPAFLSYSISSFENSEAARMIEREEAEAKIVEAIMRGVEADRSLEECQGRVDVWRVSFFVVLIVGSLGWLLTLF